MQKPIIPITLAYLAGLLLGHGFLYFPYAIAVLAVLLILTAGILTRFEKVDLHRSLLVTLPCLIGIAASVCSAAWFPLDHYTRVVVPNRMEHEAAGTIASPFDRDRDRTGFILGLTSIGGRPSSGRIRVSVRGTLTSVGYGDTIRTSGRLYRPGGFSNPGGFDYAAYLAQDGVYYTLSVKQEDRIELQNRGSGIVRTVQDWRERIRQAFLASTTGPGSAILQAMVIGEEGDLTEDIRDRFMAAGVTHIISISGSHLGMMAVLCFGLIRGLMFLLPERIYHRFTLYTDPKKTAAWLTLPLVVFYTLLAGGQVATVRSLIMISAGLMALILDRERALLHSLTLAALFILVASPQALFDISFQLSYLSVLVITAVAALWNDLGIRASGRLAVFRNYVVLLIIISSAVSVATGPIVARYFTQFSLIGIMSNLAVVPFAGMIVVPLGLFSGILSLATSQLPLAGLNQLAADAFIGLVTFFSRFPFAEFHPPAPGIAWLLCYALLLTGLFRIIRISLLARFKPFEYPARIPVLLKAMVVFSGVSLVVITVLSFPQKHDTRLSFLDVGQGDCTLIELASGKTILLDGGGTRDNRFDIGRRVVAPYLWNRGIRRLDLVILSHPHPDHVNGLLFLLRKFAVREVWSSGRGPDLPGYEAFSRTAAEMHVTHRVVSAEAPPVALGDAELRILHPRQEFSAEETKAYAAENDESLVVRIADRGRVFLFPGDIGSEAEGRLIRTGVDLKCDVLKIPHHGSKSSSSGPFVALSRPGIAVATVGRENPYRHPSDDVMERYEKSGAHICRTDTDGAVIIRAGKNGMEASQWRELTLRRITLVKPDEWSMIEKQNWQRIWKRTGDES